MTKNSFTLVETTITIAILGLVLGAIFGVYHLSQKSYQQEEIFIEITQNGRVILERITREVRQAKEIVTDLPEEEGQATSTLMFEDGHIGEPYRYIRYFKNDDLIEREVIGFYFSGDPQKTLVPWDAVPPAGQTRETETLQEAQIIGEHVSALKFWGLKPVCVTLDLKEKEKTLQLRTNIFGRNL